MNLKTIKALLILGQLDRSTIINAARSELVDPIDTRMLDLALCDPSDINCVDISLQKLFLDAEIADMSLTEALDLYARAICEDIINARVPPADGARNISRVAINNAPDEYVRLDPFIYASSELGSRPEDKIFFETAIIAEAKRFIAQL